VPEHDTTNKGKLLAGCKRIFFILFPPSVLFLHRNELDMTCCVIVWYSARSEEDGAARWISHAFC